MNWDQMAGKWSQNQGKIKERWGNLTDDDVQIAAGSREQFIGLLQQRYGFTEAEAGRQVDLFIKSIQSGAKELFDSVAAGGARSR